MINPSQQPNSFGQPTDSNPPPLNNQGGPANPAPSQPEAVPPQREANPQASTGLEAQPTLAENYVPQPAEQQVIVPKKRPFLKLALIIIFILILVGGAIFFLLFFNKGTLKLSVQPPEAQVSIDGQNQPKKPDYAEKLKAGDHQIKITLDNYIEYNQKIHIAGFKTTSLSIELTKMPVAEKLLDKKMEFIGFSPDKKYLVGLGISDKTFYRLPLTENTAKNNSTPSENMTTISTAQPITEIKFSNLVNVIWNPKKALALIKVKNEKAALSKSKFYRAGKKDGVITTWLYDFNRYDLANQESTFLSDSIGDIVWTADGTKIVYFDKDNRTLYRASSENRQKEVLANLESNFIDPFIAISPDNKFLALVPRSRNFSENYLYLFDMYSKKVSKISQAGNQKGALFSLDSQKILYSTFAEDPKSDISTTLAAVTVDGKNNQDLKVRSLIEKVVFLDNNTFLYPFLEDETKSEKLKQFNLESKNEQTDYFTSQARLRFNNILYADNAKKIYFLSENSLYSLELMTNEY